MCSQEKKMRYDKYSERRALSQSYTAYVKKCKEGGGVVRSTVDIFVCTIDDCHVNIQGRGCWFENEDVSTRNDRCPYKEYHIKKHLITVSEAIREKESEW